MCYGEVVPPTGFEPASWPAAASEQIASTSLDFHEAVNRAAHNEALWAMFSATRVLIRRALDTLHARQPDMAAAARKAHSELYAAIVARDGDRAVEIMREHLYDFAARVERATRGAGDGASPWFS